MKGALADMLRDVAWQAMPRFQARRFEEVLKAVEEGRPTSTLGLPDLPEITIGRRYRPSRAKARKVPRAQQLRLL
jgi:hypothetical protein